MQDLRLVECGVCVLPVIVVGVALVLIGAASVVLSMSGYIKDTVFIR